MLIVTLLLHGCGGGGGSSSVPIAEATQSATVQTPSTTSVNGGGVKGPLANASAVVYSLDFTQADFKGTEVASATTDDAARIQGLEVSDATQAYLLEITSIEGQTTDLSTNMFPVITTLRTVVRDLDSSSEHAVYATPITTVITDLAILNADQLAPFGGNQDGNVTLTEFYAALQAAEQQFKSALGFGLTNEVEIFETVPLITDTSGTDLELANTLAYRTAVEVLTALIIAVADLSSEDTDNILSEISKDLADGVLDAWVFGAQSNVYGADALSVFGRNPADLMIPNTMLRVSDVGTMLVAEMQKTGVTVDTMGLETWVFELRAADLDTDIDDDGVVNSRDAFPHDANETSDFDGDRIGDNEDDDDDNDGVEDSLDPFPRDEDENSDLDGDGIGDRADNDDDGDGVDDEDDDFPTDAGRSEKIDKDGDGWPVEDDTDDNDSSVPGTTFEDHDGDGIRDEEDDDDDNDGVPDDDDSFPLDLVEHSDQDGDGIGDYEDDDRDGDGVPNDEDEFPSDEFEHTDTDHDGVGNNHDTDDDNDGVDDDDDAFPEDSTETHDSDHDGLGDNSDEDDGDASHSEDDADDDDDEDDDDDDDDDDDND